MSSITSEDSFLPKDDENESFKPHDGNRMEPEEIPGNHYGINETVSKMRLKNYVLSLLSVYLRIHRKIPF